MPAVAPRHGARHGHAPDQRLRQRHAPQSLELECLGDVHEPAAVDQSLAGVSQRLQHAVATEWADI